MQVELKTDKGTFLAIKVPEGMQSVLDLEIVTNQSVIPYGKQLRYPDGQYKGFPNHGYIDLPAGDWQLIGLCKDLTEEQWAEVVDVFSRESRIGGRSTFVSYNSTDIFDTATESGISLLTANKVYLEKPDECENQFCENGKIHLGYNEHTTCSICEDIEERTGNWVLIKKL